MTPDLEALSREIAATSDAWMVPGVSCKDPVTGAAWRMTAAMAYGWAPDNAIAFGDLENEDSLHLALAAGPNLADPVTVNSLLEDRQVYANAPTGGIYWLCYAASEPPGGKHFDRCPDRTTAICHAWIAAHKEKGNG